MIETCFVGILLTQLSPINGLSFSSVFEPGSLAQGPNGSVPTAVSSARIYWKNQEEERANDEQFAGGLRLRARILENTCGAIQLTMEKRLHLESLIKALREIDKQERGYSALEIGRHSVQVFENIVLTKGSRSEGYPREFLELVKNGPSSIPILVESLADRTPTKLTIDNTNAEVMAMRLVDSIWGNPLNPRERAVISKESLVLDFSKNKTSYTLTVGDICFVALGQIVGRPYNAVRYQPTRTALIWSLGENKILRKAIYDTWKSDSPESLLRQSLMLDYNAEAIDCGDAKRGFTQNWNLASRLQTEAAIRLLYYFPEEAAPIIADRLRALDVGDAGTELGAWIKREIKNRVPTIRFIEAVAWSSDPKIRNAILEISSRSNDPKILAVTRSLRK